MESDQEPRRKDKSILSLYPKLLKIIILSCDCLITITAHERRVKHEPRKEINEARKEVNEARKEVNEAKEDKMQIAIRFLKTGDSVEKVSECMGLTLKEVQALAAKV